MIAAATFLLACIGAFVAARRAGSVAAEMLALLMALQWADQNLTYELGWFELIPALDLPVAVVGFVIAWECRRFWQIAVAGIYALRMTAHAGEAWGVIGWSTYADLINALFLAALIAIAWTGGIRDVVDAFGRNRGLFRFHFLLPRPAAVLAAVARP